jgi:transcriptional regulator with XRE-family HTH domain
MPKAHKLSSTEHTPSVDPDSAEQLLTGVHLGQRIRRLRLRRSMGLVELSKLTGLSASFLSQLETGRVVPTLRNLARLSLVFEKDLSFFFQATDQATFRIQRKKDRVRLKMGAPETDYISESFGILIPEGGVRPCMAEFLPGEEHIFQPETYAGMEMLYVTEGAVEMQRDGKTYRLENRDVAYVGGQTPRTYRSLGNTSAKALIISFDQAPGAAHTPRMGRRSHT